MTDNMQTLLKTVSSVKDTLIGLWQSTESFVDKNYLEEEGILSESIGLTGLLLMLVAFREESEVFTEKSIADIGDIAEKAISKIWLSIQENGYSADPFISIDDSKRIFPRDDGYTDTISWVLSICVLARYAVKEGIVTFSKDTQSIIYDAAADTLKQFLDSQNDDGTWGFQASKNTNKSLFFTYSAGSAIADVYDYIFGELYDDDENHIDHEFIKLLEERMGVKSIKEELDTTRKKLADWLIGDCLPLLPKLSNCENMSDEELSILGIWRQDMPKNLENRNYYNLYYVYYLVDLIVTSAADQRFISIVGEPTEFSELKKHYQEKKYFTPEEYRYYFRREENNSALCLDYIEQAIHSSRSHFLNAMRTGNDFWDNPDSELNIEWRHSDSDIDDDIKGIRNKKRSDITEPALVPMALRANVNYTYYLSRRSDVTVDNLFRIVVNGRDTAGSKNCVAGLWDDISYNLSITERSIEALVDYYDYLCEFESIDQAGNETTVNKTEVSAESEIELAIQKTMSKFLASGEAMEIIRNSLKSDEKQPAKQMKKEDTKASAIIDTDSVINELLERTKSLNDSFSATLSADQLGQLFDQLQIYSLKNKIGVALLSNENEEIDQNEINEITAIIYDAYNKAYGLLLERIFNDIQKNDGIDFVGMYSDIIRPKRK